MKTQVLRGKLEPLGLIKVLAYISNLKETGYLKLTRGDIEKKLIIKTGEIIFAQSNLPEDRLGDILLSQGKISSAQYDDASKLLMEKGFRHGRSLVEIKAITPKLLWETIEQQIKMIAYSVIPWEDGEFEFVRQHLKVQEKITLRLSIIDLVVDVVRHYDRRELFLKKNSDLQAIVSVVEVPSEEIHLDAHEKHVLNLVDGKTDLKTICDMADFGLEEGLRIIFLLNVLGIVEVSPQQQDPAIQNRLLMIGRYNEIYAYVHLYLSQQMGHVAHNLLRKYFYDVRLTQEEIFGNLELGRDGQLNAEKIMSNLAKAPIEDEFLDGTLQEALEEYLYSAILAIKRTLGTEQETIAVHHIETLQKKW